MKRVFSISLAILFSGCGESENASPFAAPSTDRDGSLPLSDSGAEIGDGESPSPVDASPVEEGGVRGCGTFSNDSDAAALITHSIVPKTTDAAISATWNAPHISFVKPSGNHPCKLVLFLSGLNGTPSASTPFVVHAAENGFHAISLTYVNTISPSPACETTADADCHYKLRVEELDGSDLSPLLTVPVADGIENRLAKLLLHLDQSFPNEGWGAYLNGQTPAWDSIIVSGHSHGSSTAGVIGVVRKVERVIMLSGPYDFRGKQGQNPTPAPWLTKESITPKDHFFAFAHTADTQTPQDVRNWDAAKIPIVGTRGNVDVSSPPYGNTNQLGSALAGGGHGTTATNDTYAPAWDYMLGK